jgi:hypothetical protein
MLKQFEDQVEMQTTLERIGMEVCMHGVCACVSTRVCVHVCEYMCMHAWYMSVYNGECVYTSVYEVRVCKT